MPTLQFEGLTLTVADVEQSIAFYQGKLGLHVEVNAAPAFAMIRMGGASGGTIGLLSRNEARKDRRRIPTGSSYTPKPVPSA